MVVRVKCPWCGHGKMHYGEIAELYGEERADVFSCRGCGSAYDNEDMEEEYDKDEASLREIREAVIEFGGQEMDYPYEAKIVPIDGLYYGFTLDGKEICKHVLSREDCIERIKEYQRANDNPMCTIRMLIPVYTHNGTVMPLTRAELGEETPSQTEPDQAAGVSEV